MFEVVAHIALRIAVELQHVSLASAPYVNDRARALSDAANRDTATWEPWMPLILVVTAVIAVAFLSYIILTRDSGKNTKKKNKKR